MYLSPVREREVENHINALQPTAAGIDDMPPKILKAAPSSILSVKTFLINLSFKSGIFPEKIKIAKVLPVFKDGDPTLVKNYRPVSVLTSISKIFERAITSRITNYLETNSILSNTQFGFWKALSTETALIDFTSYIYKAIDSKLHVAGLYLDFSKSFDMINHDSLRNKLLNIGIRSLPHNLLKSYRENRKQTVYCNDDYSRLKDIPLGIP